MYFDLRVIKSARKTLQIQVKRGEVIVRAPYLCSDRAINRFLREHEGWIRKQMTRIASENEKGADVRKLSDKELSELKKKAAAVIPERVR